MIRFIHILLVSAILNLPVANAQVGTKKAAETLNYKIGYSIFNIGRATITVEDLDLVDNGTGQYKITATGKTTGLVGALSKINDVWGANVRKSDHLPVSSYRSIREGKYKRDENVNFYNDRIILNEYSFSKKRYKKPVIYPKEGKVFEFLSGMMYIRSLDLSRYSEGDKISFKAFFEDKFYDFEILYSGKEVVKTKVGKINAIKLVPVMPDNSIFDGENSISVWISDDMNKIPLKVEADMFIGSAGCDITSAENLKYPLNKV